MKFCNINARLVKTEIFYYRVAQVNGQNFMTPDNNNKHPGPELRDRESRFAIGF